MRQKFLVFLLLVASSAPIQPACLSPKRREVLQKAYERWLSRYAHAPAFIKRDRERRLNNTLSCGNDLEMKFVEPPPSHFPTSSSSSSSAITKEEQPPLEAHGDQKPEQHSFATRVPSEAPTSNQEPIVESELGQHLASSEAPTESPRKQSVEQLHEAGASASPTQPADGEAGASRAQPVIPSLGRVRPFLGADLSEPGKLQDALMARSYDNEIIIMLTDSQFVDMTTNMVLNLQDLGMEHYLVLATDPAVCDQLKTSGSVIRGCAWSSVLDKVPARAFGNYKLDKSPGTVNLVLLWWQRWHIAAKIGELGYNVFVVDTDVVFFSDPYLHLKSPPLDRHNLIVQTEGALFPSVNVGMVYLQNVVQGNAALWVIQEVADRIMRRLAMEPAPVCRDGEPNKHFLWEQSVFNDAVESAACACVARHRGVGCGYAHEQAYLAVFDASTRPEFQWKLGKQLPRPTTTSPRLPAVQHVELFPSEYQVQWVPLRAAPPSTNELTLDPFLDTSASNKSSKDSKSEWELEPPDDDSPTIAAAPKWLFSLVRETGGWLADKPVPVVASHMVLLGPAKRAYMRALGLWHANASFPLPEKTKLLVLDAPPLQFRTKALLYETMARFTSFAVVSGRMPVIPSISCDSPWIKRDTSALRGIRDDEVVVAPCKTGMCCHFIPFLDRCTSKHIMYPTELQEHVDRGTFDPEKETKRVDMDALLSRNVAAVDDQALHAKVISQTVVHELLGDDAPIVALVVEYNGETIETHSIMPSLDTKDMSSSLVTKTAAFVNSCNFRKFIK